MAVGCSVWTGHLESSSAKPANRLAGRVEAGRPLLLGGCGGARHRVGTEYAVALVIAFVEEGDCRSGPSPNIPP